MPRTALLIIDMLNDFFRRHDYLAAQRTRLVASINTLAGAFREQGQPVIWVRQDFAPDLHNAFLEMLKHRLRVTSAGDDGCEILPEHDRRPTDTTIVKKRHSAFFGTELEATRKRASFQASLPLQQSAARIAQETARRAGRRAAILLL